MINERMSDSLKKCWLNKSKILFFGMFCIVIKKKFFLFWWAMWVNRSGRSLKMSDVSETLRLLTKNERLWVICSGCSEEMSNCERIAQVALQKWANEQITPFFERMAHSLFFGQKTSDSLGKPMSEVPALNAIKVNTLRNHVFSPNKSHQWPVYIS